MEKEILKMKKVVFKRLIFLLIVFALCLSLFVVIIVHRPVLEDTHQADFLSGFQFGLLITLSLIMAFGFIYNIIILNDSKKLKKEYIKITDERLKYIAMKSGSSLALYLMVIFIIGTVVAAYFSFGVFIGLLIALFITEFSWAALKIYYSNKYSEI